MSVTGRGVSARDCYGEGDLPCLLLPREGGFAPTARECYMTQLLGCSAVGDLGGVVHDIRTGF